MADFENLLNGVESADSYSSQLNLDSDSEKGAFPSAALSPTFLYLSLQNSWSSEVSTPSLLPYPSTIITPLLQLIQNQVEHINELTMSVRSLGDSIRISLLQAELDRARYVVVDMLRVRIKKIERFPFFYGQLAKQEQDRDIDNDNEDVKTKYFSPTEIKFTLKFLALTTSHLTTSVLKNMSPHLSILQRLDLPEMIDQPDNDAYVFVKKVNRTMDATNDGEENVEVGEVSVCRWEIVKEMVEGGGYVCIP